MLECINLVLLGSTRVYQLCITNESHKIGSNNIGVCITLHYLTL